MEEDFSEVRQKREAAYLEKLNYIYDRAGRVTSNKGQMHLRQFEENRHEAV